MEATLMRQTKEYKGLPEEHWHKQNFCWYIHDIIISIFRDCIENDKLNTNVTFKDEDHARRFNRTDNQLKWLYENGYADKADIIISKQVFYGILSDMFHFIYESLSAIEKGKIAVSLALLRKPFRDNLLYLEWLLGNPKEFIGLVYKGDIDAYAIEYIDTEKKKQIIKNALCLIDNKDFFSKMNEKVYYDLRYNYEAGNSLQGAWNKANHLVTTKPGIRSAEFNFVFLNEEIHVEFVDYYFRQVPHLLFYTYCLVIKLYNNLIRRVATSTSYYNNSLIVFKFSDSVREVDAAEYFNQNTKVLLSFPCLDCKKVIKIEVGSKEFESFRTGWSFSCPDCKNSINICKYVFWEDY